MLQVMLGLGLLSIGRQWGVHDVARPDTETSVVLIHHAIKHGIRFLDTAPSYGPSEARLGLALGRYRQLPNDIVITTKVGEHWVNDQAPPFIDHGFDTMVKSLMSSLNRIGRINILQIHKATEDVIQSKSVPKLLAYARTIGIDKFGVSVSTPAAGAAALGTGLFGWIQFPVNSTNNAFVDLLHEMSAANVRAIVNRPLSMGASATTEAERLSSFSYVLRQALPAGSIVLTGTSSILHLEQNISAYKIAHNELDRLRSPSRDHSRIL
jgi:aryl-alcohol dehydrogenase-like predicted oxidoreductase